MRAFEIESWALRILERVERKQPIEDSLVELKREWPDASKTARLLAAHANAARGEDVLWLIGVDETNGIVGANVQELSNWFSQIRSGFESEYPRLQDVNVQYKGKTVAALCFDSSRFPYVVKNQAFGTSGGGPVQFEVAWREGTSTRSATRSDLVLMLSPLLRMPKVETLFGKISYVRPTGTIPSYWKFTLGLYIVPVSDSRLTFPFHKCNAVLTAGSHTISNDFIMMLDSALDRQKSLGKIGRSDFGKLSRRPTGMIVAGEYGPRGNQQLIITGPGRIEIDGNVDSEIYDEFSALQLTIALTEAVSESKIVLTHNFNKQTTKENASLWVLQKEPKRLVHNLSRP